MIIDPVTTRWAGALYNVAARQGALDAVLRDVEALARQIEQPAMRALLAGRGAVARRAELRQRLKAGLHPLTLNFVRLLLERRREDVLSELGLAFRRRRLQELGQVEGLLESARALDPAEGARLAVALGAALGRQLLLETRITPELLGGARLTAANRRLDCSVQGRLEGLRRKLMEAPLPTARA